MVPLFQPKMAISCSMEDIKIFKSCQSYVDKTWDLDVYNKATSSSLLKLLSHENKGAKVEIGFVIQVGTGRISELDVSLFLLGLRAYGCFPRRCVPSCSAYTKFSKKIVKVVSKI